MTDEGAAAPPDPRDDDPGATSHLLDRISGDPSHELFGHGWIPPEEQTGASESYRGRHRASDA